MSELNTTRKSFQDLLECEETVFFYDKTACHQSITKTGKKIIPSVIKDKVRNNTMGIQFIAARDDRNNYHAIVATKDYQLAQRYFHMVYTFFQELNDSCYGEWPSI